MERLIVEGTMPVTILIDGAQFYSSTNQEFYLPVRKENRS
jgi:hypothetical protein